MPRDRDLQIVASILKSAKRIKTYRHGMHRATYDREPKTQDAIERQLGNIGEAASTLSKEFKAAHPEIPWPAIVGMRQNLLHRYWRVDSDIVWDTIKNEVPRLAADLERAVKRARKVTGRGAARARTLTDAEILAVLKKPKRRKHGR